MQDLYGRDFYPWDELPEEEKETEFSQTDLDMAEAWLERMRCGKNLARDNDRELIGDIQW